jgi:hypothetical protein
MNTYIVYAMGCVSGLGFYFIALVLGLVGGVGPAM